MDQKNGDKGGEAEVQKKNDQQNPQAQKTFSNVLKVKADPPDCGEDERRMKARALAGAIAHGLRQFGEVQVRCVGQAAIAKGAKCIAIASGQVACHGFDLYCRPSFIMTMMGEGENAKEMTGLCFYVVTSQLPSQPQNQPQSQPSGTAV